MENQKNEQAQVPNTQTEQQATPAGSTLPQEYLARVRAAFNGKDGRRLLHAIKHQFPFIRMADLNMKFILMQDGLLRDDEILKVVESISID